MSYQDVARGGGRELRPYSPRDGNNRAVKDLVAGVFRIQTEVSRLKHDVEKLGSLRDTPELRHKIGAANQRVTDAAQDVKAKLMQQLGAAGGDPKQVAKLTTDFEATLKDFQATMRVARSKEAASLPRSAAPAAELAESRGPGEGGGQQTQALLTQQQQRMELRELDTAIDYNEAMIEERDQGIQEIQQQIAEVNEIFQDLAVLVHDQGTVIDDIEANITSTADRTKGAAREVVRAERYQRSSRNRKCFLMLMAAGVLGVLLIVLLAT